MWNLDPDVKEGMIGNKKHRRSLLIKEVYCNSIMNCDRSRGQIRALFLDFFYEL